MEANFKIVIACTQPMLESVKTIIIVVIGVQSISSVTGKSLDEWALHKPMDWTPAGVKNMTAAAASFNTIYDPMGNVVEIFGLPGANYTAVFGPVYKAFVSSIDNSIGETTIAQLTANSSVTHVLERAVNGNLGTGTADTMVDVWGVLQPAFNVLMSLINSNSVPGSGLQSAEATIIPMFEKVGQVAAAYSNNNGLWYESNRTSTAGSTSTSPAAATAGK